MKTNLIFNKKVTVLILMVGFCTFYFSQNLVINSSFEKYSDCPSGPGQLTRAITCTAPRGYPGEYLNTCSTDPYLSYSVPTQGSIINQTINYQEAHAGDAFIACYLFNGYGSSFRNNVQMELFTPLTNNSLYYVEFWTNRASGTYGGVYAVNNIGLSFQSNFTDTNYVSNGPTLLNYNPDIIKFTNPIITDTLNWVKINGIYRANGTENYLVIGNFFPDSLTDTLNIHDDPNLYPHESAGYFFDDVLVQEITEPIWQYHDTTVYYGDSVLIGPAITGLDIDWYTANMDFIANAPGVYVAPPTSRDYIAQETFNGSQTTHVVHVTVIGGAGINENELENVYVFPNPSKGASEIAGIETSEKLQLEVRDVQGKLVYESKNLTKTSNHFELEVENGIYFVRILNPQSNQLKVEKLVVHK